MEPTKEDDGDSNRDSKPRRPNYDTRRKSSISETLNSFTSHHFGRLRTTTDIASSATAGGKLPTSGLPRPAAASRSASFFSNLGAFASKSATALEKNKPAQSVTVKQTRKLSDRLSSTNFFSQTQSSSQIQPCKDKPPTPYPKQRKRDSVQITQHGLMQPIHPGVPRSSTTGQLGQHSTSIYTPSFMRPTSSSARRHSQTGQRGSTYNFTRPLRTSSINPSESKVGKQPIPADSSFLSPAHESDEHNAVEYNTDEEVQVGRARAMSITPVRCVSSHSPFCESNFAYGLPDKHNQEKRNSSKPFDHLISRPIRFEPKPPGRHDNFSKPLPLLTPDRSRDKLREVLGWEDEDVAQLRGRDSVEYYRRRSASKTIDRPLSDQILDDLYKPEGIEFAPAPSEEDFIEEDTVIHTGEADLIKGAFASVANENVGQSSNEGDNNFTSSTAYNLDSDDPRRVSTAKPASFWLGRVSALSDRFRTEALAESMNALPPPSIEAVQTSATVSHPMHDDNRRYRRVFVTLYGLCDTEEARASLREFQGTWEQRRLREIGGARPVAVSGYGGIYAGGGGGYGTGETAAAGKVKEKKGVFEKLGLRRKSGASGSGGL
ncbi:MAG: hypothetical protein Q9191_000523 [Dirinaria sp. TL-2023a]